MKAINAAKEWLLNSGIQETMGSDAGGFKSWYDLDSGTYPYVYSEITGYGITTLLSLSDSPSADIIARAKSAADWLAASASHPSGGVRTRRYNQLADESEHYSFESGNIYAFDNGMVLYGLINLYKTCRDEKILAMSVKIADFLIGTMRKENGLFYAVYNPATNEKTDSDKKWSTQSGSYHAKLALGFLDLYDVTKNEKYKQAAYELCRKSLDFQEESGRFVTSRADKSTHLHPHSYSAEGLLYAGRFLGNENFIVSAKKAVEWSLKNQKADGGIPKKYDGKNFILLYRSDILAQTLRLAVILRGMGILEAKYDGMLKNLRSKLVDFQCGDTAGQNGGFYYGFTLDGIRRKHINSWCSMFALQALMMYDEFYSKRKRIDELKCFV